MYGGKIRHVVNLQVGQWSSKLDDKVGGTESKGEIGQQYMFDFLPTKVDFFFYIFILIVS